jgi:hypothetical protein
MTEPRTLVIGDVHGHVDRLRALLLQEGVIDANDHRIDDDVRVIQVGDLGNFGRDHTDDAECYARVLDDNWVDTVLWGNHDRAVVDGQHIFGGYREPSGRILKYMEELVDDDRYLIATEAHGFLITHAGLAPIYDRHLPDDLTEAVAALNAGSDAAIRMTINAIGRLRNGQHPSGGILWRDIRELLSPKFPQIFGHSADPHGLVRQPTNASWCVDIGGKYEARLAGLWLPEQKIARVDLDTTTYA